MGMVCAGFMPLVLDPPKIALGIASISIAVFILFLIKKFNLSSGAKISLIYLHLTTLFFPFVLFSVNTACGMLCMSCYNNMLMLIGYTLPTTLLVSIAAGFVLLPMLFIFSNKKTEIKGGWIIKFLKKYSNMLGIKQPKIYAVNKAKPLAFSFRSFKSAIFLSVGLMDIFSKKETEAVILHELAHIKQRSSALKLSGILLKLFSPFSILMRFGDSSRDESRADGFVFEVQKTREHLLSAKIKTEMYESQQPNKQ